MLRSLLCIACSADSCAKIPQEAEEHGEGFLPIHGPTLNELLPRGTAKIYDTPRGVTEIDICVRVHAKATSHEQTELVARRLKIF